jgi:hypothetical protein
LTRRPPDRRVIAVFGIAAPRHGPRILLLLAAQHVQQVVFTHRLGQRQASVLAAKVVEVRLRLLIYIMYIILYTLNV